MIVTKRIRLRPVEREDLPRYVAWFADPEVTAGLSAYVPPSQASEEKWYEQVLAMPQDERPLAVDLYAGEGRWRHIGGAGLHNIDWRNRSAEAGIAIADKSMWNQGLGTEVMSALVRHAFEALNLNRVCLRVFEDNLRARRCYEKAGFAPEGRQRQGEYRRGHYMDVLLYSVLREEWHPRGE